MIGLIIGNGLSRKNIDLNCLKGKGTIVGCNALYREFSPDYLTWIDGSMAEEIKNSYTGTVVGQKNVKGGKCKHILYRPKFRTNARSSGGLASDFAISLGCKEIYWFGFDNPKDKQFKAASIYGGTPNYTRTTKWGYTAFLQEYKELLSFHSGVTFYNVIKEGLSNPMKEELGKFSNYNIITYDDALVAQWT